MIRRGGEVNTIGGPTAPPAELCSKLAQRSAALGRVVEGDLVGVVKVTADTAAAVVVAGPQRPSRRPPARSACENLLDDPKKLDASWRRRLVRRLRRFYKETGALRRPRLRRDPLWQVPDRAGALPGCKSKADTRRRFYKGGPRKRQNDRPSTRWLGPSAIFRGRGGGGGGAFLISHSFVSTEAVYEDDDPVLRDAFDACDADGDGLVDLHASWTVWTSKFTARSVHAIDAALARWRGNAGTGH